MDTAASPTIDVVTSITAELAQEVRDLLARVIPLDLRDDRLDAWPTGADDSPLTMSAAVARSGGKLVGFVGGPIEEGRAELDSLIDPELDDPSALLLRLVETVEPTVTTAGATTLQLWARPRHDWHDEVATALGATPSRGLHQMRCPLPVAVEPIESRPYRPHDDLDALRTVNNRAFVSHPSQGTETDESLLATMAQPWFDAEGLRLHEIDGRVAGFCWTKVHQSRTWPDEPDRPTTPLGEIFVIGVDPDFHGQGKGAPMTAAGLSWLNAQGLTTGMLYVESNNAPAIATYRRLGFEIVRTDAAWARPTTGATTRSTAKPIAGS